MYFAKSKRSYFSFVPSPTPVTGPLQTIPLPQVQRAGIVSGGCPEGMVTGQIEPCITLKDELHAHLLRILRHLQ